MRVSTSLMQQLGISSLLNEQSQLSKTQQQLASGKAILTPADNPSGAAQVLTLGNSVDAYNQYQSNADSASTSLTLESNTLNAVVNTLQRAHDLAVQGLNGTQSAQARQGIATEVQQLRDQLLSLANTQDPSGQYIFGGYRSDSTPVTSAGGSYSYNGDNGQRTVQIGPDRQVLTGDPGSKVFMDVPATGGGTQDVFKTLTDLVNGLNANNPSQSSLDNIQNALKNVLTVQTEVGSRLNAISNQKSFNDNILLQTKQSRSQLQDLNFAQAVSKYQQQLVALQAAQASYAKIQNLSLFNYLR